MVELGSVLAYAITLGIPMLILGYGSMINANKSASILASINFFTLLFYFNYVGGIPSWIMFIFILVITIILMLLLRTVFTGGSN